MKGKIKEIIGASGGFTLLETALALSLLSMSIGLVGTGVFQVLHAQRFWQQGVTANKELRHVGSWFGGDVLSTDTTDLVDGAPAVDTVVLTTFNDNLITYSPSVSGTELVRTFDDGGTVAQNILARGIVSVEFSLAGDVVKLVLEVESDRGGTKTLVQESTLRK